MTNKHRVVIVGGGFGGLNAAKRFNKADVEVTLIDRRNFHLFQPLLYQVATGGLSPANIAAPLRGVLRRQRNVRVLLGEVVDFDLVNRKVLLADGDCILYDSLIVATGVRHSYFNRPDWEEHAPGLKTLEDATTIRRRVLSAFERAERCDDPQRVRELLTFVVVGGGPTGVELAGAIAELARHTLRGNFRNIDPASARVLLLEAGDRVLATFAPHLSDKARKSLEQLGVTVRTKTLVTNVGPDRVQVRSGNHTEEIRAGAILWGAGIIASPLAKILAERTGASLDRVGRIAVLPDCTLPGHPEVFVIGDMACFTHQTGKPLPGVAQTAIQMGNYAAETILRRLRGGTPLGPFRYKDLGSMATIGANHAVAETSYMSMSGYLAWLAWLFIHLVYLIAFENRVMVLFQWAWNYVTRGRTARLITEDNEPVATASERAAAKTPELLATAS